MRHRTILAGVFLPVGIMLSSCNQNTMDVDSNIISSDKSESTENKVDISYGEYKGTSLGPEYSLRQSDGKYVIFWVQNIGDNKVNVSIDESDLVIKQGEEGILVKEVSKKQQDFKFKIGPTADYGGETNVRYKIWQSNTKQ